MLYSKLSITVRNNEPSVTNHPHLAGQQASSKFLFGPHLRYAVYAVHTRFDAVEWFVSDVDGLEPTIIRQAKTRAEAMAGLDLD